MSNRLSVIMLDVYLADMYPLTITKDRYSGTYSGGEWLAFPLESSGVPKEIDGDDIECMAFWDAYKGIVGKGDSMEEAIQSLRDNIEKILDEIIKKE